MTYQVLARKWRPKTFEEVIGQDHITKTLVNALKQEKVAQAYLFTGTRGVGKTTIARIFAKALRCENLTDSFDPCGKCDSCRSIDNSTSMDYYEVDGASNNSVDDIRDLIERVNFLPTSGKYKVYVIDEVHMLSNSAFNALLKTLEEPPSHVIFVFATTDPHKLLGTVLSRCQRYDFKSVTVETLFNHLKNIASIEKIEFENDNLINVLAEHGDGSVRDALSLMDQVLSLSFDKVVDEKTLYLSLGLASRSYIDGIVSSIIKKDVESFRSVYKDLSRENLLLKNFVTQVLDSFYMIIENIDDVDKLNINNLKTADFQFISTAEMLWIYESLLKDSTWIMNSYNPRKAFEFVLLKLTLREEVLGDKSVVSKKKTIISEVEKKNDSRIESIVVEEKKEIEVKNWDGFIDFVKSKNRAIGVNLERAIVDNEDELNELLLKFSSDSKIFLDFLSDPPMLSQLKTLLAEYLSFKLEQVQVRFKLIDEKVKSEKNLMNRVEKDHQKEQEIKDMLKKNIKENKFIIQAEQLFNTKVSRIIINKDEE